MPWLVGSQPSKQSSGDGRCRLTLAGQALKGGVVPEVLRCSQKAGRTITPPS